MAIAGRGPADDEHAFAKVTLLASIGALELGRENYPAAEASARLTLATLHTSKGLAAGLVGPAYELLATALSHQGKRAEADAAFAEALARVKGSPRMEAGARIAMAITYFDDPARGKDALDQTNLALALLTTSVGTDHPDAIGLRVLQLKILIANKQTARVAPLAEALLPKVANDPVLEADVKFALARVLPPRDHTRAHMLASEARDAYAKAGADQQRKLAKVEAWLAHPG
jgi:hypothetical protein